MVITEVRVKSAELRTKLLSTANTNRAGAGILSVCDGRVATFLAALRLVLVTFETVVLRVGIVVASAILQILLSDPGTFDSLSLVTARRDREERLC